MVQTLSNMRADAPVEFLERDWALLEKVTKVLQPFKEATLWLSKSDASIAMAIPMVTTILKSLEIIARKDHGVIGLKRDLNDEMDRRFSDMEANYHYAAASLLDSKYKQFFFRDSDCLDNVKEYIVGKITADLRREEEAQNQQVGRINYHADFVTASLENQLQFRGLVM